MTEEKPGCFKYVACELVVFQVAAQRNLYNVGLDLQRSTKALGALMLTFPFEDTVKTEGAQSL